MNPFDQRQSSAGSPPILLMAMPTRAATVSAGLRAAGCSIDDIARPGDVVAPAGRLLVADTHGCTPDDLDALLASVNAAEPAGPALVILPFDQVDAVVAGLTRPGVRLLCDPGADELAGATRVSNRAREQGEDSEAERLRRIDEEVARIAQVLLRLTADRPAIAAARDRDLRYTPAPMGDDHASDRQIDARLIRRVIRARRLRDQHFDATLFADPAWDMLLDLFAATLDRGQVSVSSLCIAAAVPPTTALRWITSMTDRGLFVREADPFDKRRIFIALSPSTTAAMRAYFAALLHQGLPLVI